MNALNDAGGTESNNLCERISDYMLHSKSDNTVKKVLFILSKEEIFLYSTQLYRYSGRAYTYCALFN